MKKIIMLLCALSIVMSANAVDQKKAAFVGEKAKIETSRQSIKKTVPNTDNIKKAIPADRSAKSAIGNRQNHKRPQPNSVSGPKPVPASTYNYKCGPTNVQVVDMSNPYYYEYKIVITQDAKNITEYDKGTLYASTAELYIYPDTPSIAGTFTTDDYTIGQTSFVQYGSNTRYVSAAKNSSITIESLGGNKYALTTGILAVENGSGTNLYNYSYCYANADLNNPEAPVVPFEFTFGGQEGPQPVTPPAGLVTEPWLFSSIGSTYYSGEVTVGWDNNDIYIKGLCVDLPDAWIKGTLNGSVVTFARDQYLGEIKGEYGGESYAYPIWMEGCNADGALCDFTMDYDAETAKLTNSKGMMLVENAETEELYYWDIFAPVSVWNPNAITKRDTVDVAIKGLIIEDQTARYGEFVYAARDEKYNVELWVYSDTPFGTFNLANQTLDTYSFIMVGEDLVNVTDGEFTVAQNGKLITLTGGIVGSDEKYYRLNLSCKTGGLQYDEQDIPFSAEFAAESTYYDFASGDVIITAVNEESQATALQLFIPQGSTTIPVGTYPITDTKEVGTALKCNGVEGGYLDCSYAGYLGKEGVSIPAWFMVSGTVTVNADGSITVSAKNSYDIDINISILAPETPDVGDIFTDPESGLDFKVTSVDEGQEAVEVVANPGSAAYAGAVAIPDTVTKGIKTFNVTAIADGAFSQCTGITKLTIGKNVSAIGKAAFSFCTGLTEKISCEGVPASIGKSAFYKVNPDFIPDFAK